MNLRCPVPKILLPVDGSEYSKRAAHFTGYPGASIGKDIKGISVFRVITGSYLSRHSANID